MHCERSRRNACWAVRIVTSVGLPVWCAPYMACVGFSVAVQPTRHKKKSATWKALYYLHFWEFVYNLCRGYRSAADRQMRLFFVGFQRFFRASTAFFSASKVCVAVQLVWLSSLKLSYCFSASARRVIKLVRWISNALVSSASYQLAYSHRIWRS